MIRLLFTLVIFLSFCKHNEMKDEYEIYIGKEINQMIKDSKYSNYTEYQFFDLRPRVLSGIRFVYNDKIIELYISDFNHTKAFNLEGKWNFNDVIKEKIDEILVYKDEKIIYPH